MHDTEKYSELKLGDKVIVNGYKSGLLFNNEEATIVGIKSVSYLSSVDICLGFKPSYKEYNELHCGHGLVNDKYFKNEKSYWIFYYIEYGELFKLKSKIVKYKGQKYI